MFESQEYITIILKLLLAALLGGLIGLDREYSRRPAGLRTHMLVSVGAAIVMHINLSLVLIYPSIDPARFGASVISGIGFLGAGSIIKEGPTVHGLTTAAGLWTVAAIGLAVGSSNYPVAIVATIMILIVLRIFDYIERHVKLSKKITSIYLETSDAKDIISDISELFDKYGYTIQNMSSDYLSNRGHSISVKVDCKFANCNELLDALTNHPDILKIRMR
jgi:putative Mg2+ transporter-C (MgtC) family protein